MDVWQGWVKKPSVDERLLTRGVQPGRLRSMALEIYQAILDRPSHAVPTL